MADAKAWREIRDGHVAHTYFIAREDVRGVRVEQQRPKDDGVGSLALIVVYVADSSAITLWRNTEQDVNHLLFELGITSSWSAR